MKHMSKTLKGGCIAFAAILAAVPAATADVTGNWLTADGELRVKVESCGANLCGAVSWLKEPNDKATGKPKLDTFNPDAVKRAQPLLGMQIFVGVKPAGPGKWKGEVYNIDDGKLYPVTVEETPKGLKITGCAIGGLICQSETWSR